MPRKIRIYHDNDLEVGALISLKSLNHLNNVLKIKDFEIIFLFNGDGFEYQTKIITKTKQEIIVEIFAKDFPKTESPLKLHLIQALGKNDKMALIIQKVTELGVQEITPVISRHTIAKIDPKKWLKRKQQWHDIALSACEQCGRSVVPKINDLLDFTEMVKLPDNNQKFILHPGGQKNTAKLANNITIASGPEGGWHDQEIQAAQQAGFSRLTLGPRTLRMETAALAAIAFLQTLGGDFL